MITITIASVPDREKLVAELWYNKQLYGELSQDKGELLLEIYPNSTQMKCDDLIVSLQQAKHQLLNHQFNKSTKG